MIKQSTVFVLGAGASYPYGFPTGEGLVDQIIALTNQNELDSTFHAYEFGIPKVRSFGRDLANSHFASVDAFLEHRPDFLQVGKLAIALALRPKENDQLLSRSYRRANNKYAQMTWYHYLWAQMSAPKGQFGENRVAFVTLNYDRSLERYFYLCLKAQHGYPEDEQCLRELYGLRFVHVYGSLGDERFVEDPFNRVQLSPAEIKRAADRLRIIHEETKEARYITEAVALLEQAEIICFLGYGFHQLNNKRLELSRLANEDRVRDGRGESRRTWFTSRYGMTNAEFYRLTEGFSGLFGGFGQPMQNVGSEQDSALDVLRKLPVIQ